jgi:hypothetical protein
VVSSVGWEAFAPLTGRFRDLARQLLYVVGVTLPVTDLRRGRVRHHRHSAGLLQSADRCGRRVRRKIGPRGQAHGRSPRQQVVRA